MVDRCRWSRRTCDFFGLMLMPDALGADTGAFRNVRSLFGDQVEGSSDNLGKERLIESDIGYRLVSIHGLECNGLGNKLNGTSFSQG